MAMMYCQLSRPPLMMAVFADLPNQRALEHPPNTIPPSILITPFKPDLVLIHKANKATVIELTCPTNTITNLQAARIWYYIFRFDKPRLEGKL